MRRRYWLWAGVLGLALVGSLALLLLRAKKPLVPPSIRAVNSADLAGSAALQYAAKKYQQRGAKYVWGTNDCSVFVSDYLLRQPRPPKTRLTTWSLDQIDVEPHGLTIVFKPMPGDVLNYRYRSRKSNEIAGHCGVVVSKPDGLWVVHNSVNRGLVIQKLAGFYATAQAMGISKFDVTILRPKRL